MFASKIIDKLNKLVEEHGDHVILDEEDKDYGVGKLKYDKELKCFMSEVYHIADEECYPLEGCNQCSESKSKYDVVYRYNGYDEILCLKCFFADFEYTLYTEQAYVLKDINGVDEKIYIMKNGYQTKEYYDVEQQHRLEG